MAKEKKRKDYKHTQGQNTICFCVSEPRAGCVHVRVPAAVWDGGVWGLHS